eukprot:gene850-1124_t
MAGGLGGVASWSVVYPTDVLKTQMQVSTLPFGTDKL